MVSVFTCSFTRFITCNELGARAPRDRPTSTGLFRTLSQKYDIEMNNAFAKEFLAYL